MAYKAIVIGASAGGFFTLGKLLALLPHNFSTPILIVQHISPTSDNYMPIYINSRCKLNVKEADEKEPILPGFVYFAPPNYHLMVEEDHTISLSNDEKVNYSRPAIDILFETAAYAYESNLIGIILTGANSDGAKGLAQIKEAGGYSIVQDPNEADTQAMPEAAISLAVPDSILSIDKIAELLISFDDSYRVNK